MAVTDARPGSGSDATPGRASGDASGQGAGVAAPPDPAPPQPAGAGRRLVERLEHPVVALGLALVAAQAIFRAWALYPSWFYVDDYRLLLDAHDASFGPDYLLRPFDSQFMPVGRLVVWVVDRSGTLDWAVAATMTLALQTAAGVACLAMLVRLFGARPGVLVPLTFYLSASTTAPALMWWAAALNQVPLQLSFFLAVTAWVGYLRQGGPRSLLGCFAAVGFGLLCYVKALLLVPVLAFLAIAYFATGPLLRRVSRVVVERWPAVVLAVVASTGFAVFYVVGVPQPFAGTRADQISDVAASMLGTALPTSLLGGPWLWFRTNPPLVLAAPPDWTVHLSWVLLALVVAYSVLKRRNAWPAWVLLAAYAVADFVLLGTSRGQEYGAFAGLDYRYLTDVAPVAALCLALAFLELRGAPSGSTLRDPAVLSLTLPRWAVVAATVVVAAGGVASTIGYVHYWHHDNAGSDYTRTLRDELRREDGVTLVNQTLPTPVMPPYTFPLNQSQRFVTLFSGLPGDVSFPRSTARLRMIDDDGHLQDATVSPDITSPVGPRADCGWAVGTTPVTVPLETSTFDWDWWMRIAYLSSAPAQVTVTAAGESYPVDVTSGLGSVFVHAPGEYDEVTLRSNTPGATVCVDAVEVGSPVMVP